MSDKIEKQPIEKDVKGGVEPLPVPAQEYQRVVYENNLFRDMIIQLNVKIYWLERKASNK